MINAQYLLAFGLLLLIPLDMLRRRITLDTGPIHILTALILWLSFAFELLFGNTGSSFFLGFEYAGFVEAFVLFLSASIYTFFLAEGRHSVIFDMLFLSSVLGASLLVLSSNLMSLLISFELMTVPAYGLVIFGKNEVRVEGAVKYVLFSFVSTAVLVFGVSLIYVSTGSLSLQTLSVLNQQSFVLGLLLVLAGLAYEATLVPFHMWAVDTYDASDNSITSFLILLKSVVLVVLLRLLYFFLPYAGETIRPLLLVVVLLTIAIPNIFAITQERVKRMLVYASISQAGFSLAAIAVLTSLAAESAVFYIFSFAVGEALVFLSLDLIGENGSIDIGGGKIKKGIPAVTFIIGLLSLAGVPPFIGFFAKFLLFYSLFSAGYSWLVLVLVALLVFSVFYYFRLMRAVIEGTEKGRVSIGIQEAILVLLSLVVIFGSLLFYSI